MYNYQFFVDVELVRERDDWCFIYLFFYYYFFILQLVKTTFSSRRYCIINIKDFAFIKQLLAMCEFKEADNVIRLDKES